MTTTRKNQSLLAKASLAAAALTALSAHQEAQAQKPMNFVMAPPVMLEPAVVANDANSAKAASAKLVSELSADANALASFNANPVGFLEARGFQRDLQVELLAEFGGFVNPAQAAGWCICTGCCVTQINKGVQDRVLPAVQAGFVQAQQFQMVEKQRLQFAAPRQ